MSLVSVKPAQEINTIMYGLERTENMGVNKRYSLCDTEATYVEPNNETTRGTKMGHEKTDAHDEDQSKPHCVVMEDTKTDNVDGIGAFDNQNVSTIKSLWIYFRENTTLHGIKYVKTDQSYRIKWVIWLMVMLGMGALLVFNAYELFTHYGTYPTISKLEVVYEDEMQYPAITICNLSPYKKSSMNPSPAMESFLLHTSAFGLLLPRLNYSDPMLIDLNQSPTLEWFDNSSFTIDDMFLVCRKGIEILNCSNILSETITKFGRCFTFNGYKHTQENGQMTGSMTGTSNSLSFVIDIKQLEYVYDLKVCAGVKVVLHDPEEEPDFLNNGFIASPGFSSYVSMKMTKFKYLPAPYKARGSHYCVNSKASGYVNPLKYYSKYSRSACLLECKRDYVVGKCGCQSITDRGTDRVCTFVEMATCYLFTEGDFETIPMLKEECSCQPTCEYTTYEHTISSARGATVNIPLFNQLEMVKDVYDFTYDVLELRLYYDTLSYLSVESIPEYKGEDIVGIFGGQLGLFLGASLLTAWEFLESILFSAFLLAKKLVSVVKQKRSF